MVLPSEDLSTGYDGWKYRFSLVSSYLIQDAQRFSLVTSAYF